MLDGLSIEIEMLPSSNALAILANDRLIHDAIEDVTMHKVLWFLCIGLTLNAAPAMAQEAAEKQLRLNQIQVVGTHNSYHLRPPEAMLKAAIALARKRRIGIIHGNRSRRSSTRGCATSRSI